MKHTRKQIEDMSHRSGSHADALATLYELIMAEVDERSRMPKIRRERIRFAVDGLYKEHDIPYRSMDGYAIAEAALAALGCTIVDDDPEVIESPEYDAQYEISKGAGFQANHHEALNLLEDEARSMGLYVQTGDQAKRLRTLHEAKELIEKLIQETAQ